MRDIWIVVFFHKGTVVTAAEEEYCITLLRRILHPTLPQEKCISKKSRIGWSGMKYGSMNTGPPVWLSVC